MMIRKPAARPAMGAELLAEWDHPRHMTPYLPTENRVWQERASEILMEAARLQAVVHPNLTEAFAPVLEVLNGYYSNLIEGHRVRPFDIQQALADATSRKDHGDLVIEACAHLMTQRAVADRLHRDATWDPAQTEALRWIHHTFTTHLPKKLRWCASLRGHVRQSVIPGEYRCAPITIGRHDPPAHGSLPLFMDTFAAQYGGLTQPSPGALAKIAAAHQRFTWIHPFLDGNGRVARFMTDAMLERSGMGGGGLWQISRGFAGNIHDYQRLLANADAPRQGSVDGRGNLSQRGLDDWCHFVLDQIAEQIRFMRDALSPQRLSDRIHPWVMDYYPRQDQRRIGMLITLIMQHGEIARSTAEIVLGVGERQARNIITDLLADGVIAAKSRGPLRPAIPLKVVPRWFPGLFPMSEDDHG